MGRPKKDKVMISITIDRELKSKLDKYPNIEKSALINELLWDEINLIERESNDMEFKEIRQLKILIDKFSNHMNDNAVKESKEEDSDKNTHF